MGSMETIGCSSDSVGESSNGDYTGHTSFRHTAPVLHEAHSTTALEGELRSKDR